MHSEADQTYQLYAALNLSGSADGVSIPVYTCYPQNEYFIASTDNYMRIKRFQVLDMFEDYIIKSDVDIVDKTQFMVADLSPVIIKIDGRVRIIQSDDVMSLLEALRRLDISASTVVRDVIQSIDEAQQAPHQKPYATDAQWIDLPRADLDPKSARLWLDIAVADIHEKYGRPEELDAAKARARVQLLSWATKIAAQTTTPIFKHFLEVARRIERQDVYVQDILGTALVNWVCQNVARRDWLVDLVRDFRRTYRRGPLTSVLELLDHSVPTLSEWASDTLHRYHHYIRSVIDEAGAYELLAVTFVADDGRHWPDDLRAYLQSRLILSRRHLDALMEERRTLADLVAPGQRIKVERAPAMRRLRDLAYEIQFAAGALDALEKSLSDDPKHHDYSRRFMSLDYSKLGLNRTYFTSLTGFVDDDPGSG